MEKMVKDLFFWKNKRVFLTGHTGFKGSWLCRILTNAGARLTGYALKPGDPGLFNICGVKERMTSVIGDIRDADRLMAAFSACDPEIVIHMAAQPLVRNSYKQPTYTYEINVMGTVNILECARLSGGVISFLNVTTDKVYRNNEWDWGYRENDTLDGYDPYSNSKSCAELITASYQRSFFNNGNMAISTARAGNVIGGGDFAADRIVPDCMRAAVAGKPIFLRNPHSVRSYQHVLEPLMAYLMIARGQYESPNLSSCYNVGPDDCDCVSTAALATLYCELWGDGLAWETDAQGVNEPREANFLRLDSSRIKNALGWKPRWNIREAVAMTVAWNRVYEAGGDVGAVMDKQINDYLQLGEFI